MLLTDCAGSHYTANRDGSNHKALLFAQLNLTGIAYVSFQRLLAEMSILDWQNMNTRKVYRT